jgi:enamine deaminase RidA (YjgF/YER057c/UK114 family)
LDRVTERLVPRLRVDAWHGPPHPTRAPNCGFDSVGGVTGPAFRLVRVDDLAPEVPYAYAAVVERGAALVLCAGACPLDAEGNVVAPGDVAAQAEQVMQNLLSALRAAGAELRDVVRTTVYVASNRREDLATAWDIVRRHFGDRDPPGTLVGVTVLGWRDQLVEVEAVAAVP